MIRSFPPTNSPKVRTTLPGSPVFKIRRVEDTFSEIRKIVVNKSKVGKKDISSTSVTNKAFINTINAMAILIVSMTSSKKDGIGTIKNIIAANKYSAIPISAFFMLFFSFHRCYLVSYYLFPLRLYTNASTSATAWYNSGGTSSPTSTLAYSIRAKGLFSTISI